MNLKSEISLVNKLKRVNYQERQQKTTNSNTLQIPRKKILYKKITL